MTRVERRLTACIAAGVLSATLAVAYVQSGLVDAYDGITADAPLTRILPCADEGSPGPCYWDAYSRGNGAGLSFTVDTQQVVHYEIEGN